MNYTDYGYLNPESDHIHTYILPKLEKMLNPLINKRILDVGCGNGWLVKLLISRGFDAYGIDASESGIQIASQGYPHKFFVQNIDLMELPDQILDIKFDTIISTEVIEHLYDPISYLRFCEKILKKNGQGQLIISTPYHGYIKNLTLCLLNKMDNHFTVLWQGGHIKFWSKRTLFKALRIAGFIPVSFTGCGRFSFMWNSMLVKSQIT